ncbi:hypothetical protein ACH3VR_12965 [Microbacterium sp. B2969]|uniref:WXG100 family type VII secretion target n=1 Tax=Microbacterium alkaliflavum TaxID=3248839 RepID=A0ABW7Q8R9_9MICO
MPSAIDPDKIPGKDIDPDAIESNASTIRTIAGSVRDNGSNVHLKWQGMAGVYEAPEAGTLLGLMQPVSSQATTAGDNLEVVSGALTRFAADVRPIKAELDSLRLQAEAFGAEISGGVQVQELNPAWVSTQGYYGTTATSAGYSPYSTGGSSTAASDIPQYRDVTKQWHEVQEYVDRNNDLISQVNAQQVALWDAERTCANTIRALFGGAPLHAYQSENDPLGYGLSEIPEGTEMPWGAPVERTEGCGEHAAKFVFKDFLWEGVIVGGVWGTIEGLGTLVLGYNPATGDWFSGDAYGAAWGNLGLLAAGLVISSTPPLNLLKMADDTADAFGGNLLPHEITDFTDKADEALLNTGKALIAWDQWQDDPGTALGETVFNVGTILIPAGAAITGVKTAGTAASVLSKMARVVDLVDPSSWAVNGALKLAGSGFAGLDNILGTLDTAGRLDPAPIEVYTATDATSGLSLLDDMGVDLNTVRAGVDSTGNPILTFDGGRVELPAGAFDNAAGITHGGGGVDAAIPAPVREPELVTAGAVNGETGPGAVNAVVHDAPVRTETGAAGESTTVQHTETTTGGGGIGHGVDGVDPQSGGGGGSPTSGPAGDGPATDGPGGAAAPDPSGSNSGGSPGHYTAPDGQPYVPKTSPDQIAQFSDAEPRLTEVASEHGLTMADLYHLVHERPVTSLTPDEARVVLDIRESVPLPANGEIMQKVLGETDLQNLLTRKYWTPGAPLDTVGGFVARAADAQKLVTADDLMMGFGLDYAPGRTIPDQFLAPDGGTYAVRFELTDDFDVKVPARDAGDQAGLLFDRNGEPYYHPSSVDPLGPDNPYHGNGFVGNGAKEMIPEYHLPAYTRLPDGTEVWRITPSGEEELVAALINEKWIRF